jgi:uncharacterized protein
MDAVQHTRDILRIIDEDAGLRALLRDVRSCIDTDPGHDLAHVLRVALWTLKLGEHRVDTRCAIAAALLHDIVNVPKNSPHRADASRFSADAARERLPSFGFTADEVDLIAEAILTHSFSAGGVPRTALGEALQDADRLEALGALGVLRTASCGGRMGASFFHAEDPWAQARELDDQAFTIDHFFRKLLPLAETLRTEAGRTEARRRRDFMIGFLIQLGCEIGNPFEPDVR